MIRYIAFLLFLSSCGAVASKKFEEHHDATAKQPAFKIGVSLASKRPLSFSARVTVRDENSHFINTSHHPNISVVPGTTEEDFTEIVSILRPSPQRFILDFQLEASNLEKEKMTFQLKGLEIAPTINTLQIFETSRTLTGQSDFTDAIIFQDKP
jgi:hypothetical protein